ncbi:hypothetical protein KDM41_11355 [bacterium]|nr:hypothetical protein [bacterium]
MSARAPGSLVLLLLLGAAASGTPVRAADAAPATAAADTTATADGLHYLVPELRGGATHLSAGPRQFRRRVAFSPAVGRFGADDLFALRLAFNPDRWLGYEISLGHNPSGSLHAVLHTLNVQLRYPLSGRLQPYASLGYGMMTAYPGQAIEADPVTKNVVAFGGGLEAYLRDDVALRGEARNAVVLGQERGEQDTVAYSYAELTLGLVFYRSLGD